MSVNFDLQNCKIKKLGPIITSNKLIFKFSRNNICNPCVFKRPSFLSRFKEQWIMLFSHHYGQEIRVATTNDIESNWSVKFKPLFKLSDINFPQSSNANHLASPDIEILADSIRVYFHAPCGDEQFTYTAESKNGYDFKYDLTPIGMFYFRHFYFNGEKYAVAKYRNDGGVVYKFSNQLWIESGRILPKMRHCYVYSKNGELWILWTEIGDCPEKIYIAKFNPETNIVEQSRTLVDLTEVWEGAMLEFKASKPGQASNVAQLRDPFLVEDSEKLYLFYTYRGEEGIALAKITNENI